MILKTLREFELEEENRALRRELAQLRDERPPPIIYEETPDALRVPWDTIGRDLYRVALLERTYDARAYNAGWRTKLECRQPPPDQPPGDPVRVWRAGYFIAREAGITDEALAHIGADMHRKMIAELSRGYLQKAA